MADVSVYEYPTPSRASHQPQTHTHGQRDPWPDWLPHPLLEDVRERCTSRQASPNYPYMLKQVDQQLDAAMQLFEMSRKAPLVPRELLELFLLIGGNDESLQPELLEEFRKFVALGKELDERIEQTKELLSGFAQFPQDQRLDPSMVRLLGTHRRLAPALRREVTARCDEVLGRDDLTLGARNIFQSLQFRFDVRIDELKRLVLEGQTMGGEPAGEPAGVAAGEPADVAAGEPTDVAAGEPNLPDVAAGGGPGAERSPTPDRSSDDGNEPESGLDDPGNDARVSSENSPSPPRNPLLEGVRERCTSRQASPNDPYMLKQLDQRLDAAMQLFEKSRKAPLVPRELLELFLLIGGNDESLQPELLEEFRKLVALGKELDERIEQTKELLSGFAQFPQDQHLEPSMVRLLGTHGKLAHAFRREVTARCDEVLGRDDLSLGARNIFQSLQYRFDVRIDELKRLVLEGQTTGGEPAGEAAPPDLTAGGAGAERALTPDRPSDDGNEPGSAPAGSGNDARVSSENSPSPPPAPEPVERFDRRVERALELHGRCAAWFPSSPGRHKLQACLRSCEAQMNILLAEPTGKLEAIVQAGQASPELQSLVQGLRHRFDERTSKIQSLIESLDRGASPPRFRTPLAAGEIATPAASRWQLASEADQDAEYASHLLNKSIKQRLTDDERRELRRLVGDTPVTVRRMAADRLEPLVDIGKRTDLGIMALEESLDELRKTSLSDAEWSELVALVGPDPEALGSEAAGHLDDCLETGRAVDRDIARVEQLKSGSVPLPREEKIEQDLRIFQAKSGVARALYGILWALDTTESLPEEVRTLVQGLRREFDERRSRLQELAA